MISKLHCVSHPEMFIIKSLQAAFVQLNPFPRRGQLASWHHAGFLVAKEQWNKRERQRLESEKQEQQQQVTSDLRILTS